MKIFLCELGDRSHGHYIKGQLRAKKSVNSGVQLRTELCTLVYLFIYLLLDYFIMLSILLVLCFGLFLGHGFHHFFLQPSLFLAATFQMLSVSNII